MKHVIHPQRATKQRPFLRHGAGPLTALAALSFDRRTGAERSDPVQHVSCPARSLQSKSKGWAKTLSEVLAQPRLMPQFLDSGMIAVSSAPAELAARIATEQRYRAPVLRSLAVRIE
jgi:hypothetical protein